MTKAKLLCEANFQKTSKFSLPQPALGLDLLQEAQGRDQGAAIGLVEEDGAAQRAGAHDLGLRSEAKLRSCEAARRVAEVLGFWKS